MKLTKSKLRQIIKEELGRVLSETNGGESPVDAAGNWNPKYKEKPPTELEAQMQQSADYVTRAAAEAVKAYPNVLKYIEETDPESTRAVKVAGETPGGAYGPHAIPERRKALKQVHDMVAQQLHQMRKSSALRKLDGSIKGAQKAGWQSEDIVGFFGAGLFAG